MTPEPSGPPKSTERPADGGSASRIRGKRLGILLCVAAVAAGSAILLLRKSTANLDQTNRYEIDLPKWKETPPSK